MKLRAVKVTTTMLRDFRIIRVIRLGYEGYKYRGY